MLVLYLNNVLLRPEVMTKVLGLPSLAAVYGQKEILLSTGEEVGEEIRTKAVQAFASEVYGTYTSLVYLTPIAGGLLADQIFGQHAMIIAGSIIMAIGHGLLSAHETFVFGKLLLLLVVDISLSLCVSLSVSLSFFLFSLSFVIDLVEGLAR